MARVAVLVVAYRSAKEVAGLMRSIARAGSSHEIDVHVTDNSVDGAELARLAAIPGVASVADSGENLGYGRGMNRIAGSVGPGYDWFLICNPDVRFEPGSIEALVASGEAHPEAALFGPRIVGSDGRDYPSARAFPSIRTGIGHALFASIWPANPWTRRYHHGAGHDGDRDTAVDWVSGACILARPSAFEQVGGFDEGYFMYFEDVDLAWRLAQAGWATRFVPDARITHSGAHATRMQADNMRRVHHESAERYLSNKYRGPHLAPVRGVLRLGLLVRRKFFRG